MGHIQEAINAWFSKPFRGDGSALDWIAFVGLILIAAYIWRSVIATMEDLISG